MERYLEVVKEQTRGVRTVHVCRRDTSLGAVISTLVQHRVHRVFVIDESEQPIGVVSLRDVIAELLTNA